MPPDSPDSIIVRWSQAKRTMTTILHQLPGRADRVRPSKSRALGDSAAWMWAAMQHLSIPDVSRFLPVGSRLFAKYVALVVGLVSVALLANGASEIWFFYREHKASLIRIEREQAESAAAKISQFVKSIEAQLGWTVQLPWDASTFRQRQIDAWRLFRQVSAISELSQVDPSGLMQLRISRTEPDEVGRGIDVSREPKFRDALSRTNYYGPVYFRQNSEPYMTLALSGARDAGVSVAEVNLTFMWDVGIDDQGG